MKNIIDKTEPNKWEGHPLIPITAFVITAIVALGLAGLINYGINSYHANKLEVSKESRSINMLITPYYDNKWIEIGEKDSTEFIYRK